MIFVPPFACTFSFPLWFLCFPFRFFFFALSFKCISTLIEAISRENLLKIRCKWNTYRVDFGRWKEIASVEHKLSMAQSDVEQFFFSAVNRSTSYVFDWEMLWIPIESNPFLSLEMSANATHTTWEYKICAATFLVVLYCVVKALLPRNSLNISSCVWHTNSR